jgi:hypothetical protein
MGLFQKETTAFKEKVEEATHAIHFIITNFTTIISST